MSTSPTARDYVDALTIALSWLDAPARLIIRSKIAAARASADPEAALAALLDDHALADAIRQMRADFADALHGAEIADLANAKNRSRFRASARFGGVACKSKEVEEEEGLAS